MRQAAAPVLGWGFIALALGALSVVAMSGELRVPRQVAGIAETATPLFGLSHRSAATLLERCETYLADPITQLLATPQWRSATETCHDQGQLIADRWPTDARAWLLIATTSSQLGDDAGFAAALTRSQQLAPAVQWLAERRLKLANRATDTGGYTYEADVRSLLDSDIGAQVLAGFWIGGDDARRTRIETAAEAAPPALQQRLLDKIRERAAARQP